MTTVLFTSTLELAFFFLSAILSLMQFDQLRPNEGTILYPRLLFSKKPLLAPSWLTSATTLFKITTTMLKSQANRLSYFECFSINLDLSR